MINTDGGTLAVDRLRLLLDRLGSPDLTLAEAKTLRESVMGLIADRSPAKEAIPGERSAPTRELAGSRSC